MSLFGQSRDSLKEHIYPSFRAQSDKLQRETQCAHQAQKHTFTYKLRKPLNHKQRVLALGPGQTINVWRPNTIKHCLVSKHFTVWTPCLVLFDRVCMCLIVFGRV